MLPCEEPNAWSRTAESPLDTGSAEAPEMFETTVLSAADASLSWPLLSAKLLSTVLTFPWLSQWASSWSGDVLPPPVEAKASTKCKPLVNEIASEDSVRSEEHTSELQSR